MLILISMTHLLSCRREGAGAWEVVGRGTGLGMEFLEEALEPVEESVPVLQRPPDPFPLVRS